MSNRPFMRKVVFVFLLVTLSSLALRPNIPKMAAPAQNVAPAVDPPLQICSLAGADFTISASPSSGVLSKTSSMISSTISVEGFRGFSGTLSLTNSTSTAGLNITLSPKSVAISGSVIQTATLKVTNTTDISPGSYSVSVVAANSTLTRTASVTVNVPSPGFSLVPAKFFLGVVAGSSNKTLVTATSLNGFAGTVSLSSSFFPVPAPGFMSSLSKTSVALSSSGSAAFNLTVSTSATTPRGFYFVMVSGMSGSISNFTSVEVEVTGPDFDLAAPFSMTLGPGSSTSGSVNVTSVMGFSGTVSLTASVSPSGTPFPPTASLATPSVTVTSGGKATDLVTVTALATTPYNLYSLVINASTPTSFHLAYVTVTVNGLDISSSKAAFSVTDGGAANTTTITLQAVHGFSGNVTLSGFCSPLGDLSASLSVGSAVLSSGGMATATLTVSAGTYSVPGTYSLFVSGMNVTTFPSFSFVDNYTLMTVTVIGPDFTLTPAALTVTFSPGMTTSTVSVTPMLGFTGAVYFSSMITPNNGLLTVSCTTVTGSGGTSTCTYTSSTPGTYYVFLTGTSGFLSHKAPTITVIVGSGGSFTIASSPTTVSMAAGATGTSTITTTPIGGFTATVTLGITPPASGISCSLSITSIVYPAYATSTLSCSGSAGTYTVTVTGTSGSTVLPASTTFTITPISTTPDFSLSASTISSVNTGVSTTSTITLAAVNSFSGTVTLSVSPSAGLTCTITPSSLTLPSSTTSTLSCSSSSAGTYTATVTATGGGMSHTQNLTVTVNAPAGASPSSPPYILYGGIAAAAAAGLAGLALYLRNRGKQTKQTKP